MLFLPIQSDPVDLFAQELRHGFTHLGCYVGFSFNDQLFAAYLMREDGTGIRIRSSMNDVEARLEVGALIIERAKSPKKETVVFPLPKRLDASCHIEKLVLKDTRARFVAESGLSIRQGRDEIIIVAAGQPFGVCVFAPFRNERCAPEYDVDDYQRMVWDGVAKLPSL